MEVARPKRLGGSRSVRRVCITGPSLAAFAEPASGLGTVASTCGGTARSDSSGTGAAFPGFSALYLERAAKIGGDPEKGRGYSERDPLRRKQ